MEAKKIKKNLFRFTTLRNPQLVTDEEKEIGFIFHPDPTKSIFYAALEKALPGEEQAILQEASQNFSALKNRKEVQEINSNLYKFSTWLMRNKYALSYEGISDNINGAKVLSTPNELLIWDNLIYQTIVRDSVYIREALIQMLIANGFLRAFNLLGQSANFTEEIKAQFLKRANASVVVSNSLFSISNTSESIDTEPRRFFTRRLKQIEDEMEMDMAKERTIHYQKLLSELQSVAVEYNKATQRAYELAVKTHQEAIEEILRDVAKITIQSTAPVTGEVFTEEVYPNIDLPEFVFEKTDPINTSYLASRISPISLELLQEFNFQIYDEFPEVIQLVNEKIKTESQLFFSHTTKASKKVKIGGSTISLNPAIPYVEPYAFFASFQRLRNDKQAIYMFLGTAYDNARVVSTNYDLQNLNTGTSIKGNTVFLLRNNYQSLRQLLYPQGIVIEDGNYSFSGIMTLDNGVELAFNVANILVSRNTKNFTGTSTVTGGIPNDDDQPIANPTSNNLIYGITKLGIADFRRIEQEVCCYVPGEVSHIENIMAKEYKERSSRNLTSIENTTEETTEREVERSTDTSSTERNELQSEIAAVLSEDQSRNYGGGVGFSGGGFSISAHADFSSSSAVSNSNNIAQSYAEEITERAAERILQNISKKRTSRILKEFEENNSHGFDNTQGDRHVTGIYRWVDKVYKNTLFNYGKRLTYEFAIPEPAKFFQEAIKKEVEDGNFQADLIVPELPIHPKDFILPNNEKLGDSSKLNKTNYQVVASYYNAAINAYPDTQISISKSYSKDDHAINNGRLSHSGDSKVDIPEGYRVDRFKGYFTLYRGNHEATWKREGTIVVAGKKFLFYRENSKKIEGDVSADNIVNSLEFSVSSWDVGSYAFNLVAICSLTEEAQKRWKDESYNGIMEAYQQRVQEYNDAVLAQGVVPTQESDTIRFNPLYNRKIEQREIKRIAIDLLAEAYEVVTAQDNYLTDSFTTVKKDAALQQHSATVKFFEQAFDWEIMSYVFYPYFYAKRGTEDENWVDLFQSVDAADPIFQAFLQSGMARAVVPVRPGFEDAINWYMATGEIWNGQGLVTDLNNDLYLSIAEEMRTIEGEVEGSWETRLPTALTIIQAQSAALLEGGLPCFCEEYNEGNTITTDENTLSGKTDSATAINAIRFSFFNSSGAPFETIGEFDEVNMFPLNFGCMGQQIQIQRDALWTADKSTGVIYQKLAEQLSLIEGVTAQQVFSNEGAPMGLEFTLDLDKISTFSYDQFLYGSNIGNSEDFDSLEMQIDQSTVKVLYPKSYPERIFDKNNLALTNAEVNVSLPIDRFKV